MSGGRTPLLILGAGSFAQDVADIAADIGKHRILGFIEGVDPARCAPDGDPVPVHWIDDVLAWEKPCEVCTAIGDPARETAIGRLKKSGFRFCTLVHPTAHIAPSASIGVGCVVAPGAIVSAGSMVGDHVLLNRGALVGHHTTIREFCTIGPGANIASNCSIGASSYVGIGATLIDRINLAAETFVGAGALVTRSYDKKVRLVGVRARVIAK